MTAVDSNKSKDVTTFKSNEAYSIVEQHQAVAGGRNQEYEDIQTAVHSINKHQQSVQAGVGGRRRRGDVTIFNSNEAYNIVEQHQAVGGGGIHEYEEIGSPGHSITHHQRSIQAGKGRGGGGGGGGGRGGGGRRGGEGSIGVSSTSLHLLTTSGGGGAGTEEGLYEVDYI